MRADTTPASGLLFTLMLGLLLGAQPVATDLYLPALPAMARELGSASSSLTLFMLLSPAIYIEYLGLSPLAYGWVPASSGLLYFSGTLLCRLQRQIMQTAFYVVL